MAEIRNQATILRMRRLRRSDPGGRYLFTIQPLFGGQGTILIVKHVESFTAPFHP